MCYDLGESDGSQEHLLWGEMRYSQKKEWVSFVFYYFENPSIAHNFGTTGLIQVRFSAKCTSPNKHFNQIENWKCHIRLQTDFLRSHHRCASVKQRWLKSKHHFKVWPIDFWSSWDPSNFVLMGLQVYLIVCQTSTGKVDLIIFLYLLKSYAKQDLMSSCLLCSFSSSLHFHSSLHDTTGSIGMHECWKIKHKTSFKSKKKPFGYKII